MRSLLSASILVLMFAAVAIADDAKDMVGTWTEGEGTAAGEKLPAEFAKFKLLISAGKYAVRMGDMEIDKGTFKIDDKKNPKQMEIVSDVDKGKTLLAIYELKGDTLKVCYDIEGKKYPTEFASTKENKWLLITYKRGK